MGWGGLKGRWKKGGRRDCAMEVDLFVVRGTEEGGQGSPLNIGRWWVARVENRRSLKAPLYVFFFGSRRVTWWGAASRSLIGSNDLSKCVYVCSFFWSTNRRGGGGGGGGDGGGGGRESKSNNVLAVVCFFFFSFSNLKREKKSNYQRRENQRGELSGTRICGRNPC